MADTLLANQSQSVRCAICARPARRGATLCAQCKVAVRGTPHSPSVHSEHLPPPVAAVAATRYRERVDPLASSARRTARAGTPHSLGGWGAYATLIAFGLAVCLTGYLAIGDKESALSFRHESPAAGVAHDGPAPQAPPAPSLAPESGAPTEGVPPGGEQIAWIEWSAPTPRRLLERKPARGARLEPSALAARDTRNPSAVSTPRLVVAEPAVVAVPVTTTPEPVVRDRWQELASAMSRCERENLLAGIVCKESARLRYCEGEWGNTPQCTAAVASNNTR